MKTFGDFLKNKIVDRKIEECANLMAQTDIVPEEFVNSYFELLDTNLSEGFWSDAWGKAKDAWGRWSSAGTKVAKSVYDGGLKSGLAQGKDIVAGPKVKFEKAVAVLKDVAKFLQNNERTSGMASRVDPQMTIARNLDKMIELLSKEVMPVLGDPQVTQNYNRAPSSQGAQQAQPQQAQPQQAQQQVSNAAEAAQRMSGDTFQARRPDDSGLDALRKKHKNPEFTSEGKIQ